MRIDATAPLPRLGPPTLDLTGYTLTFNEEFEEKLSVSRAGPGTRWIAHTPYWGDFGDAGFADPTDGFPFTTAKGILRIEARKQPDGKWKSGLLSSVDTNGNGFSQKYGYFECKAKFPKGPGMWPAFWLMGVRGIKDKTITNPEIDVVEQYSAIPNSLCMALHQWGPQKKYAGQGDAMVVPSMTDDFHTYGALVDEKNIVWYFDRVEMWRTKTPESAKVPLYVMVNLAMGSGWPIDQAPSPSYMDVDYVKVWAK
jgi:beta-glucanase (GH16 family)